MSRRGLAALVVVLAGLAGIVVVGRETVAPAAPFFAETEQSWMPAVGVSGSLTGTWYCPGVPATDETGVGGDVVVSNREATQLVGKYTIHTAEGVVVERELTVPEFSQSRIDVAATLPEPADFASVVVEIEGGRGFVEQRAIHPAGESVAACATNTSDAWYLADGFTLEGSVETLVLTNPFDEQVTATLRFSTEQRQAEPGAFRGFIVPPRSVRTIPIAQLGARDEPVIAVAIEVTSGRLVVGRAQHYTGGGRLGYDVSLAAPALRDQWWFADGERSDGVSETYSIYNPTDDDVEVTVFFGGLPIDAGVEDLDPIRVPARRVVVYDPYAADGGDDTFREETGDDPVDDDAGDGSGADETGDAAGTDADGDGVADEFEEVFGTGEIPEGRHATVFSTLAQPSIVVERVITRPTEGGSIATSVVLGAPPRLDGYVAGQWHLGIGPRTPTEDALVVYNIDQTEATVTVEAIGPAGPTPIASLTDLELPAGSIITVDLVDPDTLGQELIVTSTSRVFVERLLPRGGDLAGRSGSWLLPAA